MKVNLYYYKVVILATTLNFILTSLVVDHHADELVEVEHTIIIAITSLDDFSALLLT